MTPTISATRPGLYGMSRHAMKSFKTFRLDTVNHLLWRNGERVLIAPKGFDVLAYLVQHAGRVVTQDEILEELWPET